MRSTMSTDEPRRVDRSSIILTSQACAEDLESKGREKKALLGLLADLKRKRLVAAARTTRKKREADALQVETVERDKKSAALDRANAMARAELAGVEGESRKLRLELEVLDQDLMHAKDAYAKEATLVAELRHSIAAYRREIGQEGRKKEGAREDLRATRAASRLMEERVASVSNQRKALVGCVRDTIATR